jgi:hypothetical protein
MTGGSGGENVMRTTGLTAVALSLSLSAGSLDAQTVSAGERVRVTIEEQSGKLTGTLEEWGSDTLYVVPDGASQDVAARAISLSSLSRLETSRGMKSNAGKGALIGGGIGLVIGGGMSLIAGSTVDTEVTSTDYLIFTGLVTVGGAGIGALIGALIKSERWQEYPLDGLHVGLVPTSDGGFQLTAVWHLR